MAKLSNIVLYIQALIPSLWFNFRYLPFKEAIKLPILIYKPHFLRLSGKVIINAPNVYFGMIRLGFPTSALFPNNGITLKIEGRIIFRGRCHIGNDCYVVCGKHGKIDFGDYFKATAGLKMVSESGIRFGKHTLVGWGNYIIDTNFHPLYDIEEQCFRKTFGEIELGDNNWLSSNCMMMFGVKTSDNCVFGARSVITRSMRYEPNCLYGGVPIRLLRRNVKRIHDPNLIKEYTDKCK